MNKAPNILILILALALLTACGDWVMEEPDRIVLSGDTVGLDESAPPEPSYLLPTGPPSSHGFGLAWSPVAVFDPYTEAHPLNVRLLSLCYEGLYTLDPQYEPQGQLCRSMELSDDGLTATLTLRTDAVFSDGQALTAQDVVHAIDRARESGSRWSDDLRDILSAAIGEDGHVVLTLARPHPRLEALLTFPVASQTAADGLLPAGTGVYVFGYDAEGLPILTPNEHRRSAASVSPYRIDLMDADDLTELSFYFQYGHVSVLDYDFNDPLSPGLHSGYERYDYASAVMQYIGVNPHSVPLGEAALRQVLSMTLDREAICAVDLGGFADAAVLPVPPVSGLYNAAMTTAFAYQPEAAARLLATLDVDDADADGVLELTVGRTSHPLQLTMLVGAETESRAAAAHRYAAELHKLGIELTVTVLTHKKLSEALVLGEYDLYWAQTELSADFALDAFFTDSGSLNFSSQYRKNLRAANPAKASANPFTDMLGALENYRVSGTETARRELYSQWLSDGWYITVCFGRGSLLAQRGLLGYPTPSGWDCFFGFSGWNVTSH